MARLKKEDYLSETTKQLKEELLLKTKEDRERAYAEKFCSKIPQERKQYILDILSRELGTK